MNLSKREQSQIERTLAATLTDACEAAAIDGQQAARRLGAVNNIRLLSDLRVEQPLKLGAQRGHALPIRQARVAAGAVEVPRVLPVGMAGVAAPPPTRAISPARPPEGALV